MVNLLNTNLAPALGYLEFEKLGKSLGIDGLILYNASNAGFHPTIFREPLRIYNQEHGRAEIGKPFFDKVRETFAQLISGRKSIVFNNKNWGLAQKTLPEENL